MKLIVERADVWAASLEDQVGGLARVLKRLKDAGSDLDFIIARRDSGEPGRALVFITPLRGAREVAAAEEAGFNVDKGIHSVRVQGQNEPGLASDVAGRLAEADINVRGLSAAELGTRFVMYIGLDSEADADRVVRVLRAWGHEEEFGCNRTAA